MTLLVTYLLACCFLPCMLQVACSAHGNYFFTTYQCAQYPDHCLPTIVEYWINPLQEKYISDVVASGHPGFVHSCFLGAYWNSA